MAVLSQPQWGVIGRALNDRPDGEEFEYACSPPDAASARSIGMLQSNVANLNRLNKLLRSECILECYQTVSSVRICRVYSEKGLVVTE
jgi:hypothetical protein